MLLLCSKNSGCENNTRINVLTREKKNEKDIDTVMNTQMGSALPNEKLDRNNFVS